MFEENVNKIVKDINEELDLLKVYVDYSVTFKIEREINYYHNIPTLQAAIVGFFEACQQMGMGKPNVDTTISDRKPLELYELQKLINEKRTTPPIMAMVLKNAMQTKEYEIEKLLR